MSRSMAMTPERWQRLQVLFDQAFALDAHARAEFVVGTCGEDLLLREQLLSLVLASTHDSEELSVHVERELTQRAAAGAELNPGSIVGRYRIERLLGRGGMGAVYLAERADNQFKQQVAIKVVAEGAVATRVAARLRSERQILANLNHPNIARLLDGGATADGKPYFAMEYVDGQRIDRYCEDRQLSLKQRLKLFVQVCGAVQYAHQRLIIHRDIKPSNILVTKDGMPKLLDFGIAKLADPASTDLGLTRVHERVLSPESASPEQVRGEPLGTVSDVYALGVLLYELMTRLKPHNFTGRSFAEIAKMILQDAPAKPSTAVLAASKLELTTASADAAVSLRGELDTIVLKAMHKDATRRYDSASALAEDIDNYLANRPVHARPDNLRYRTQKFWQRNRLAVSSAAVVTAAIVALVAFYTWRLAAERDAAERERLTATRTASFMTEVFRVANPNESRGNSVQVREVLDAARQRIDKDLQAEPRVRATLAMNIAQAYIGIGLWQQAESILQNVAQLERTSFGSRHLELADALLALAAVENHLDKSAQERSALEEAWSIRNALGVTKDRGAIQTLTALAINASGRGDQTTAMTHLQLAEKLVRALYPADTALLGQVIYGYGRASQDAGDYSQAEQHARRSLPLLKGSIEHGTDLYADALYLLVETLTSQSRPLESQTQLQQLIMEHTTLLGADHPLVGMLWNYLGVAYCENGDYAPCREAFLHGVEIQRKQPGPENVRLAMGYHNLGTASHDAGDLSAALTAFTRAQGILRKVRGNSDSNLLPMLYEQAGTLREAGQFAAAEQALIEADSLAAADVESSASFRGHLLTEHGRLSLAKKQNEKAVDELRDAIAAINPQDQRLLAHARLALGQVYLAQHQCSAALDELQQAVAIRRKVMSANNWFIADAESKWGDALSVCGSREAAEPLLSNSVAQLQQLRTNDDLVLAAAKRRLEDHRLRSPSFRTGQ